MTPEETEHNGRERATYGWDGEENRPKVTGACGDADEDEVANARDDAEDELGDPVPLGRDVWGSRLPALRRHCRLLLLLLMGLRLHDGFFHGISKHPFFSLSCGLDVFQLTARSQEIGKRRRLNREER